jgi:hypothetical protein
MKPYLIVSDQRAHPVDLRDLDEKVEKRIEALVTARVDGKEDPIGCLTHEIRVGPAARPQRKEVLQSLNSVTNGARSEIRCGRDLLHRCARIEIDLS